MSSIGRNIMIGLYAAAAFVVAGAAAIHWWPAGCHGLVLPAEVRSGPGFVTIPATTTCKHVRWRVLDQGLTPLPARFADPREGTFLALRDGRFRVLAWTAHGDEPSDLAETVVIVGNVPPGPFPPTPPGPLPPVPPTPPQPPAPIPDTGLRVLMVYETAEISKLPRPQAAIFTDSGVRAYLNAHCVKGVDGKTAEWRLWDKDVDVTAESPLWQAAFKRPHDKLPWLLLSTGTTGYEGPLPATTEAMLELLKKYGG